MTRRQLPTSPLGSAPAVSTLGLGCMGMAEFYGPADERESIATIRQAVHDGVTLIDTAYMYGGGESERIVGRALTAIDRGAVTLATKCGLIRTKTNVEIDGRPEHIRVAIDESLGRLGTDYVDLYYLHRIDPKVPVEESVGAMAELVTAGKVRYLGVSEASADTVRRAHATHPLVAIQNEYSLCTREPERELLPLCRELGIAFVAWGPLSRGLLAGGLRGAEFGADDVRSILPRFSGGAFESNLALVDRIARVAAEIGHTPAQVALAWDIAHGAIPIPGAMNRRELAENLAAVSVTLTPEVIARLGALAPVGAFTGPRFHEPMQAAVDK